MSWSGGKAQTRDRKPFSVHKRTSCRVSIGLATPTLIQEVSCLIEAADRALYRAKRAEEMPWSCSAKNNHDGKIKNWDYATSQQ
jgi:GGDEF domain-containing protein